MKFSYTHKTISIALSFLVLFSTLSLTIEKHFCGDVLIDVAIFSESEKCGMDMSKITDAETVKKDCCKDEIDVLEGPSEVIVNSYEDLDTTLKHVLFAYSFSYINLFEDLPNLTIPHYGYFPPMLIKDIQCIDETYLI